MNGAFLEVPRSSEEALVDRFAAFARNPGEATFASLPLREKVSLGLGSQIVTDVPAMELIDPGAWSLDVGEFRGSISPFSTRSALERLGVFDVITGRHPHCASDPMRTPDDFATLKRVSGQPRLAINDGCLMWFTIDFFVDPNGAVAAITLDMWEP
ncbi:MAG: hypothetical protein OEM97_07715 [Acidimicrobiia bacterium]|nr:hypothetical protein [Acidimicrobiia bacterium]